MTSLKQIIDTYNARGFKVKHIQMPQKNPGITRHNAMSLPKINTSQR